jgi:hypothetical protein
VKIDILTKTGTALAIIVSGSIIIVLILFMSNVPSMTPQELELTNAVVSLAILEFEIFIPIYILVACVGAFWSFLPKEKDDPIIRMVKTCGIMGGLFISLIVFLIMSK